jgi:hypothetical protein
LRASWLGVGGGGLRYAVCDVEGGGMVPMLVLRSGGILVVWNPVLAGFRLGAYLASSGFSTTMVIVAVS